MKHTAILFLLVFILTSGCEGFLDAKPEKSLIIPNTLNDFQALLDAEPRFMNSVTKMGFLASDEIQLSDALVSLVMQDDRAAYLWDGDFYPPDSPGTDWTVGYQRIFYSNVVIEGVRDYSPSDPQEQQRAKELDAAARFHRAFGHFLIAGQFMGAYDPSNPEATGIPIRNSADLNAPSPRLSMGEVMAFIVEDLEIARQVLPDFPDIQTRASAWAAEALLSRIFLYMQDYENALIHSGNALSIENELLDYNEIDPSLRFVFPRFNKEVIYHAHIITGRFQNSNQTYLNPELVELYDSVDLRSTKVIVPSPVPGLFNFQGRYSGEAALFAGLATDEVVLDFAEASARLGNDLDALEKLNYLLVNRYEKDTFSPLEGLSGMDLIQKIAEERRKELLFRGIRWLDLKRYNQNPATAKTISRSYMGNSYQLEPGSPRYIFPIPPREVRLNELL